MDDNFYLDLVTDAGDSDTDTGSSAVVTEDTPRWSFEGAFHDIDWDGSCWMFRHVPEGAWYVQRVPDGPGMKPSENPAAYDLPTDILQHLLGGPDD